MSNKETTVKGPKPEPFDLQAFLESGGISGRVVKHRSGAVVYSQGDPCDSVLYIQKGGVKLRVLSHAGKEAIVAMLGPGRLLRRGGAGGSASPHGDGDRDDRDAPCSSSRSSR